MVQDAGGVSRLVRDDEFFSRARGGVARDEGSVGSSRLGDSSRELGVEIVGVRRVAGDDDVLGERREHGGVRVLRAIGIGRVFGDSDDHRFGSRVRVERILGERGTLGMDRGSVGVDDRHVRDGDRALRGDVRRVRAEQRVSTKRRHDHLRRRPVRRLHRHHVPSVV